MILTENFTIEELTATSTGLNNAPGERESEKLLYVAAYLLQPVRSRWGRVMVTSGFRSPEVNARVGSKPTSQHTRGEAADFLPLDAGIDEVFRWIVKESGIRFGQIIRESVGGRDWIHISLPRLGGPNWQALVYDGRSYRPYA